MYHTSPTAQCHTVNSMLAHIGTVGVKIKTHFIAEYRMIVWNVSPAAITSPARNPSESLRLINVYV